MDDDIAIMLDSEPKIAINGVPLTPSQSMALRVAASSFYEEMSESDALGDDEAGRGIAKGYRDRLAEVLRMMVPN